MSGVTKEGNYNIVRQYRLGSLTPEKLKMLAEALGIPDNERDRIISAQVVISPPPGGGVLPTTPGGSARSASPRRSTPRSPARARRRQSE